MRDMAVPKSSDAVTISANIETDLTITEAAVYYDVVSNGSSAGYAKIVMNNTSEEMYEGQIPAQAEGSNVNYYLVATDNNGQSTMVPADTSIQRLWYFVRDDASLSIKDIQYTPWERADSPLEGHKVEVTGIVTVDTSANNTYRAYSIQDAEAAWSGIFAFNLRANLNRGDEVTVFGTVTDYNADYHYKWDNNTVILVDSFKLGSSGNAINPVLVTTGTLANASPEAESYEGVLVQIRNATLISVNSYDVTLDDGSGPCLVDGDFMLARDQDENKIFYVNDTDGYLFAFGDTLRPGARVDMIQGVFTYSFGTIKIEVRNADDFGTVVGVNPDFKVQPLSYNLDQNFPNPFNPETRIYFDLPQSHDVRLVIYNMLGQKVRTLVSTRVNAGHHVINWDGRDDLGMIVPSGVYIYRIKAGDFLAAKKMLMLK